MPSAPFSSSAEGIPIPSSRIPTQNSQSSFRTADPRRRRRLPRPFRELFLSAHFQLTREEQLQPDRLSVHYRSLILRCKENLQLAKDEANRIHADILEIAHKAWHFIEVVYIIDRSHEENHISVDLAEWFIANYPDQVPGLDTLTNSSSLSDDDLWDLIARFIAIGDMSNARQLISSRIEAEGGIDSEWSNTTAAAYLDEMAPQSSVTPSLFSLADSILQKAPANKIRSRRDKSWKKWQTICNSWAVSEEFAAISNASRVFQILAGNSKAIAEVCSSWEAVLVACSIYLSEESTFDNNLWDGFQTVIAASAEASVMMEAPKDGPRLALIEASMGNCMNAIIALELALPSVWFSAHMCEILVRTGTIPDTLPTSAAQDKVSAKEAYFMKFASELEAYKGCWRLAADYYMACPTLGDAKLIELLMGIRFQAGSDPVSEKALHLCQIRNLPKTARRIQAKLGSSCLENNNLGGAISWFAAAGSFREAQKVAALALRAAEREGPDSNGALMLINVVKAIQKYANDKLRQALDHLNVYKDMQDHLKILAGVKAEQKENERDEESYSESVFPAIRSFFQAADSLLRGGVLPRRYWGVVVFEFVRVLEEFPEAHPYFPRPVLLNAITAMELVNGPHSCKTLAKGLHDRLKWDASDATYTNTDQMELGTEEHVEHALNHCRKVLARVIATSINNS